jgi:hypothetical protein
VGGELAAGVAGVDRPARLDQQYVCVLVGLGAVLHASRHNEQLSLTQLDVAVAQLDRQAPSKHEEEVVRVVVLVPDEFALHPHHHQLVVVQVAHDARAVGLVEQADLLREVHLVIHAP